MFHALPGEYGLSLTHRLNMTDPVHAGFRHRDLRVDNVMEAAAPTHPPVSAQAAAHAAAAAAAGGRGDGDLAAVNANEQYGSRTATAHGAETAEREPSAKSAAAGAPPFSAQQLAAMRFKIIDFGHADVRAFHG